ncbi:alpha/beta hydrolase [Gammaproteobacteria bacterium]|nr:alpha/beta hydrolase [Gammaproteobacteria bacterium]
MSNNTIASKKSYQKLALPSGASLAYSKTNGSASNSLPGIIFLPGFMSDMNGEKALSVENFARERGQSCVRFDYFGHGNSSGDFADGHIGIWVKDVLSILDELTEGPQLLVGSSMGGWLMLLTAMYRPQRIAGLIGIAAAPDFTEDLLMKELTSEQLQQVKDKGFTISPSKIGNDYLYSRALFDEGRKYLVLRDKISVDCPVRLLHGLKDDVVPWQTALTIQEKLMSTDVKIILVKNGDHRLSSAPDLECLVDTLDTFLKGF